MPEVKKVIQEIEKVKVLDRAERPSEAPILSAVNLERQKNTALDNAFAYEINAAETLKAKEFSQSQQAAVDIAREKASDLAKLEKIREKEIAKKKKIALEMNILKTAPKKKPVQNQIKATVQAKTVVRTRNSNGTMTVQNPKIDLKPKGAGNGMKLFNR